MMNLYERVEKIQTKTDLVEFIMELLKDIRQDAAGWENSTLEDYLSALASWIEDSDGYYRNQNRPIPETPSWRNIAEMLIAAKMYE